MDLMPRLSSNGAKRSANGASPDAPPRYAAIKQSIYDAIGDGRLKPGDRVPSEADLVEQFDVSRMTANRALSELQSAGILVRRAGRGPFIPESKTNGHHNGIRQIANENGGDGQDHSEGV